MIYFNDIFMQKFMSDRLMSGMKEQVKVHDYIDVVPVNPITEIIQKDLRQTFINRWIQKR